MKKIVVLAGLAAAAYGALKLFRGKDEDQPVDYYPQELNTNTPQA